MAGSPAVDGELDVLVHNEGDDVGVAIRELGPGSAIAGWLDSQRRAAVVVNEPIPLGYKVALSDLGAGAEVTEYKVRIALTRQAVRRGDLVHTHNIRSARWQQSA